MITLIERKSKFNKLMHLFSSPNDKVLSSSWPRSQIKNILEILFQNYLSIDWRYLGGNNL